jgi:adenylate cyclase
MIEKNITIEFINEAVIEIKEGQSILEASLSADIPHYHTCGGRAQCSTCRILVLEGMENLTPINENEHNLRLKKNFPEDVRLACQTKILKEYVKVRRIIRDDEDLRLYVTGETAIAQQSLGEEKELVLFFLDIRNFTPFIESNLPFDVIHIMRRLTVLFNSVINNFNGKIVESPGDGIYAVFGLKECLRPAAVNAYKAAKKIIDDLTLLNKNYIEKFFEQNIEVGIGIHAGKVLVGDKGYGDLGSMMVMGFPVVIAARLEEATKELNNNLVVSEFFYSLLQLENEAVPCKKAKLKGVSSPVPIRLMGEKFKYISKTM